MRAKRIWILFGALALLSLAIAWLARAPRTSSSRAMLPSSESTELVSAPEPTAPLVRDEKVPPTPPVDSLSASAVNPVREPPHEDAPALAETDSSNVSGRVVDAGGNPLVGIRVLAKFAIDAEDAALPLWKSRLPLDLADPLALGLEPPRGAITDAEGRFGFGGCAPGRFRLALRSDRWAPRDFDDLILPAESHHALPDFELEPGVILVGIVVDSLGRRLEGALLARIDDFYDPTLPELSARVGPLLATTDRNGMFRTPALAAGPSSITVRAPASSDPDRAEAPEIRVEAGSTQAREISGIQIELPASARVIGQVASRPVDRSSIRVAAVRAATGSSVVPAACRADYRSAGLRSNGTFALDGLIEGEVYELRAISPTQSFDDDCPWSPPELAVAGQEGDVTLVYKPDCSLGFEVEDAKTHARVEQYTVALQNATPREWCSDDGAIFERHENGQTRIEGLRPLKKGARFTLELAGDRFRDVSREEQLTPGGDLDLATIGVDLLPLVDISVREEKSGEPIAGARLCAWESDASFGALGPRRRTFGPGASPSVGGSSLHTRAIDSSAHVRAGALQAIGYASEREEKDFVARATTDARGSARVAAPLSNTASILVRARGFAPAKKRGFEIRAGGSACTIALQRGARLRVRVIDGSGAPIAGIRVEHAAREWTPNDFLFEDGDPDPLSRSRVTNAAGTCTFEDLGLGRHTFRVARRAPHLDGEWKIVSLAEGGPQEVDLVTRAFGNVAGRVHDGAKPLAGVRISACPAEFSGAHAPFVEGDRSLPPGTGTTTYSRGSFTVRNLEPGAYLFVFEIEGQSLRIAREVQVDSGDRMLNVDVGQDLMEGLVKNADGSPAANARLWVVAHEHEWRFDFRYLGSASTREGLNLEPWMQSFPSDFTHPAVFADETGHFSLRGLAHNVAFTLFASDGVQAAGSVRLGATRRTREERAVAIVLEPRGSLRVTSDPAHGQQALVLVARNPEGAPRVQRLRPGLDLVLPALEPGTWSLALFEERGDQRYFSVMDPIEVVVAQNASETIELAWP